MQMRLIGWCLALGAAIALDGRSPSQAQAQVDAPPVRAAQSLRDGVQVRLKRGDDSTPTATVDESALRYHASRGDRAAVAAEIARLQARHPGWEPPEDLFAPPKQVDERPLWALYDAGDYGAARAEIARLAQLHPGWQAPANLLALIEEHETRAELSALEGAKDWAGLVKAAAAKPDQISCARIDNMWRLAEAHGQLADLDQATRTYARILAECTNAEHRIGTLQKAADVLKPKQLGELLALAGRGKPSAAETAAVAALQARHSQPRKPTIIQRVFAADASISDAEQARAAILAAHHAAGAERVGWLYFDAQRWADAQTWFRHAHGWAPSAKTAEGLARAGVKLGDGAAIESLARQWPEQLGPILPELRAEWVTSAYDRGDHRLVLEQTAALTTPTSLTLRGWTFLQLERPTEAALTFEQILAADSARESERREAAYGLARTRLALGNLDDALLLTRMHLLPPERSQEIEAEVLVRRATAAFEHKDYRAARMMLDARRGLVEPDRDLLLQEAWTLHHLGQSHAAERIFARLDRAYSTEVTREGLKVTQTRINGFAR
jgi:tetratricopeptide (TPR) repeat protein